MADIPNKPETRKEAYLAAMVGQNVDLPPYPMTREEAYLNEIAKNGGGSGGTKNYNQLNNKPQINGNELSGNKDSAALDLMGANDVVANPQDDATDDLAKIKIKNTVYEIPQGSGSGGELTKALNVSVAVGGIKVGDSYVSGDSIEDLLHDMLDPVAYPTLTNPSVSLAGSGSKLLETGATLAITLTATFNRGSINPAYGTSGFRSGPATGYILNGGTEQSGNTWSETVTAQNKSFSCVSKYSAGEQPKDSTGADYSSPLPAGQVSSETVTYDFVDAMWANTANITAVAKLSLVAKSTKQRDMTFPAQTIANPEIFDIPASWTVTAVQVKNDLSGQYEDASDQFTVTNTTHNDAAGNSVAYKRYTFNKGFDTGARTVRVKWS